MSDLTRTLLPLIPTRTERWQRGASSARDRRIPPVLDILEARDPGHRARRSVPGSEEQTW